MSDVKYTCDANHAINFARDVHKVFGHLQVFKIGTDVTLATDLNVMEPKEQSSQTVAGLLTELSWGGGPEDSLTINALISSSNRQKVLQVVHKAVSNVKIKFQFVVYDYDPDVKKWFRAFNTQGIDITGYLEQSEMGTTRVGSSGSQASPKIKIELSVATDPTVAAPPLFTMTAKIRPSETVEDIHFLTNYQQKIVKKWGVPTT